MKSRCLKNDIKRLFFENSLFIVQSGMMRNNNVP